MSAVVTNVRKTFDIDGFKFTIGIESGNDKITKVVLERYEGREELGRFIHVLLCLIDIAILNKETPGDLLARNHDLEEKGSMGKIAREIVTFLWEQSPAEK